MFERLRSLGGYMSNRLFRIIAPVLAGFSTLTVASAGPVILPVATSTINLNRGAGFAGSTAMNIAFHPGFNQYYGGHGGNINFSMFVWDSAGNLLQTFTPSGVDTRALNYNGNTGALEDVTFNAIAGGNPSGLVQMGLDGSGLFNGSNTNLLGALPGLDGSQTMPAYDSARNQFYSRSASGTLNVVSRFNGSLLGTIPLDLVAAGSPALQGEFVGYDSFFDVFITLDITNQRALVHDFTGAYLGASSIGIFNPDFTDYNVGYANGQLFAFDQQINAWRGYDLFEESPLPEPSTVSLMGVALAVLFAMRKRVRS